MPSILLLLFVLFNTAYSADYDFSGTVQINGCSGFFVSFKGSKLSDQATVMTAGHCASIGRRMNPGEVVYQMDSHVPVKFLNSDASVQSRSAKTDQLIYATVTDTDISFYSLQASYKEIIDTYEVMPLLLSDRHPTPGQNIQILASALKTAYECQIDGFVFELREEEYIWRDSLRYTRNGCRTVGGSSGAPVLDSNRMVIGINNTGNLDGEACTGNNACEVSAGGVLSYKKGSSYGQQTYQIYSCLDKNRELDLEMKGCRLYH